MVSDKLQQNILGIIAYLLAPTKPAPLRIKDTLSHKTDKAKQLIHGLKNRENIYDTLGNKDIDIAYKVLSLQLHPDKVEQDATEEQRQQIREGFDALNELMDIGFAYETQPIRDKVDSEKKEIKNEGVSLIHVFRQLTRGNLPRAFEMFKILGQKIENSDEAFKCAVLNNYNGKNAEEIEKGYEQQPVLYVLVKQAIASTQKPVKNTVPTPEDRRQVRSFLGFLYDLFLGQKLQSKANQAPQPQAANNVAETRLAITYPKAPNSVNDSPLAGNQPAAESKPRFSPSDAKPLTPIRMSLTMPPLGG